MNSREWLQTLDRGDLSDLAPHEVKRNLAALRWLGLVDSATRLTGRGEAVLAAWERGTP